MHPESRKFLRFMVGGKVYQFKVLYLGLATAPQVFTRVMAPVSAILQSTRVRLRRHLDDWLIQASSREQGLLALETVLQLCESLGIVVNWEKSQLIPTQRMVYLGVILDSISFRASPALKSREASLNWRHILILRKTARVILARAFRSAVIHDPARPGRTAPNEILPVYSSETLESCRSVCSGGMDSRDSPGFRLVAGSRSSGARRVSGAGVPSARLVVQRLGRGLGGSSRRGSRFRPLGSRGTRRFHQRQGALGNREGSSLVRSSTLRLLRSNFRRHRYGRSLSQESGGTHSSLLNSIAQRILRWAESLPVLLSPQFIMGKHNVLADSLSRPNQVQGSEWTLNLEVFQELRKRWPVSIDLFATSLNHRCSLYFSSFHDRSSLGTDALLQNWNGWQVYAFPPWSIIPAVLKKLRSSSGILLTIIAPYWPQRPWFPDLLDLAVDGPVALALSRNLLHQPHFHRFHLGVSRLSLHAWRLSSDLPVPGVSPSV